MSGGSGGHDLETKPVFCQLPVNLKKKRMMKQKQLPLAIFDTKATLLLLFERKNVIKRVFSIQNLFGVTVSRYVRQVSSRKGQKTPRVSAKTVLWLNERLFFRIMPFPSTFSNAICQNAHKSMLMATLLS